VRWLIVAFTLLGFGLVVARVGIAASGRGQRLILTVGTVQYRYILSERRVGVDMDWAKVLDFQTRAGWTYALLDIGGPSRRLGPTHECGAGYESSLVWLRLKGWRLLEIRAVRYESCWFSLEADGEPQSGARYSLSFWDFGAMKYKTVSYDRAYPERGFALIGRPMPK
jgi:hypothetical protein